MIEIVGKRQKELLRLLLKNKTGMTVDKLSAQLAITRNAVRQHLAALENEHLVARGTTQPSGGRPEQLYFLTDKGNELFPRQYSWFAQLLVDAIQQESGPEGLTKRLVALGTTVGTQLKNQHPELKTQAQKLEKLAEIMQQLGYEANVADGAKPPAIVADNCVFHHLAMKNPDICQFDLALLSSFTGNAIEHQECMARNGNVCRFKFNRS
ncbi:MAG TPA: HTH domain-containing protein [Methylophilaceae bacterium]|jgi:predicted ArsR family transcriptional regulator